MQRRNSAKSADRSSWNFYHGLLAAAVMLATAVAAAEPSSVDEFFAKFSSQRDSISSLQATFVQTTVTPDEQIVSEGTLTYLRPKRLIFRYDDPPLVYMIDALRVYEYDEELRQLQLYELEDRPESEAFYLGFEADSGRLREAYDVHVLPPDDPDRHALVIEFTPKPNDDEAPYFQRVRLHLSLEQLLPSGIDIVNDDESHTSFQLSAFRINETLTREQSHIAVPPDTVIVDNDEYVGEAGEDGEFFPPDESPPSGPVDSEDLP